MPIDLIEQSMRPLARSVADHITHELLGRSEHDRKRLLQKMAHSPVSVLQYGDVVAVCVGGEPVVLVPAGKVVPAAANLATQEKALNTTE